MVDLAAFALAGAPGLIRGSAGTWSAFSAAAERASDDIRRVDCGDFIGDEADTFRDRLGTELPPHLLSTSAAWSAVASALGTYADVLERLQSRLSVLAGQAFGEQRSIIARDGETADANAADVWHTSAREAAAKALKPGELLPADGYHSQAGAASARRDTADAALQSTMDAANQLHAEHNAAVDECVRAIDGATAMRFAQPPGIWGRFKNSVTGWVSDHVDVLKSISGALKQISSIAGVLAMVPALSPVMAPIAATAGGSAVLIDAGVHAATGQGSMSDILLDAGSMLPLGRGLKLLDGPARGAAAGREARTVASAATEVRKVSAVSTAAGTGPAAGGVGGVGATVSGAGGAHRAVDLWADAVHSKTPAHNEVCASDPINVISGQMVLEQIDVVLPGVLPLVLRRVHHSRYRWGSLFGSSWASTLDQRLELGSDGWACFVAEDGVVLYYPHADTAAAGDAVLPTEGARWPLRRAGNGTWSVEDPDSGLTRTFAAADADGRCHIRTIADRNGNVVEFSYSGGVINSVRHSGGYRVDIGCRVGRVVGLSMAGGENFRSFSYDGAGRLSQTRNSSGEPLMFDSDEHDRIVGWRDRNGTRYRYQYDEVGHCVRTSGRGRVLSYGFSFLPGRTLVTDSLGSVSCYEYNQAQQLTRFVDPLGNVTSSLWDSHDRLLLRTDPLGSTTQFDYRDGRLARVTHPDATIESVEYNAVGRPVRAVDASGADTVRTYDAAANLLSVTDASGGTASCTRSTTGALSSVTDALGSFTEVQTNAAGLPIGVVDALGGRTVLAYDNFGRLVESMDPLGGRTKQSWTGDGRLSARTYPDGAREHWTWDGEGNLVGHVDPAGGRTAIEIGVFDLPVTRTGPDGGTFRFSYDTELRLTSVQNPAGLRWTYDYDAAGRMVAETDFNGRRQHYHYDGAGRMVGTANALAQATVLRYDAAGNLIERSSADGVTAFTYDRARRMVAAVSPGAVVEFARDPVGRLIRETINGRTVTSTFDAAGRRVSRATPAGAQSRWTFDAVGRPASLETAGHWVQFGFDAAGREVSRGFSAGGQLRQEFDAAHRLLSAAVVATTAPTAAERTLTSRSHGYRVDGALATVTDRLAGTSSRFDVDVAGRATRVQAPGWDESYVYDSSGRITGAAVGGDWTDGSRDYSGTLITRAGHITFGHDRQGRVTTRSVKRLSRKTGGLALPLRQ